MIETVNLTRVDDRWVKTVKYDDEFRFDDMAYKAFRHVFGSEYLPDLYRAEWHPEGNVVTLEYDHIEGEQFPPVVIDEHGSRLINKTMKMIALKVIPDFIEFSKSHMNAPMVYMHTDLKMDNIRIRNGKPYLIDIDSMGWIPATSRHEIYSEYEV